jgi:hypothetical protein
MVFLHFSVGFCLISFSPNKCYRFLLAVGWHVRGSRVGFHRGKGGYQGGWRARPFTNYRSLESESRYELGEELGSGTFGTVFAAKVGGVQVAIKKYKAENVGQAKLDAAEVAVPGTGCYWYP